MFQFETIESRQLLAATNPIILAAADVEITAKLSKTGVLTVTGTSGKDVIEINQIDGGKSLRITSASPISFLAGYGRKSDRFDLSLVKKIVVNTGAGKDRVKVATTNSDVTAELNGGSADDTLIAQMSRATLRGGAGNDSLFSDRGNITMVAPLKQYVPLTSSTGGTTSTRETTYTVVGIDSFNQLDGGSGDDRLATRGGEDSLYGGDGNDTVVKLNDMNTYFDDLEPRETVDIINTPRADFTNRNRVAVFDIESILAAETTGLIRETVAQYIPNPK